MDFQLDDARRQLLDAARLFARESIAPKAAERDREKSFPTDLLKASAARGYFGCLVPKDFGGIACGNIGQSLILEEVAAACASTHVALSVHNSLVCGPINKWGTDEQKRKWLPDLASGKHLGAYLLTEPGSGSDAAAMKTVAQDAGDHFVLNGDKMWITSGDEAQVGVVFARTDLDRAAKNVKAISAFVLDLRTSGVTFGKREPKLGLRGSSTVAVFFKDVKIPKSDLLGELNQGFGVAMDTLNGGRIGIAIQAIGIGRAAIEWMTSAAKELRAGDKKLGETQLGQFRLAELATKLDAARLLAWRAADMRDRGITHIREASMAKLMASQVANEICREAVTWAGESAYDDHAPVERLLRDARVTELYEGTTEVQKIVISKQILSGS